MSGYGVYVHLPWCRIRCPYCAFYVEADRNAEHGALVSAIGEHFDALSARYPGSARTLYFGGGTPSRTPLRLLAPLIERIAPEGEVTLEANPEDIDDAWAAEARRIGITRISLGVQTLSPTHGRTLGRARTVRAAERALDAVAGAGFDSWSADLIWAVPDQTVEQAVADVRKLARWAPPHVSAYGLTWEPGTAFERALERGRLHATEESSWRAIHDAVVAELAQAGLDRYEVSNFAKPGHEAEHNALYWTGVPYMGLGPSAHGLAPDGARSQAIADVKSYTSDPLGALEWYQPTPEQAAIDLILSNARWRGGLDLTELAALGWRVPDATLRQLQAAELVQLDGQRLSPTPTGYPVSDAVVRHLVERLEPC